MGASAEVKKVLIIGGGFAGLKAAKILSGSKNVQVELSDRRNHHLFQPLLYQVATAGLNPGDIAVPIRAQFKNVKNVRVTWGEAKGISLAEKSVYVRKFHGHGEREPSVKIGYDYLILACGAHHSYFGRDEWEEVAPGLKTVEQATEIRRRILSSFERAENEDNPEIERALLTFVVVGGGPTGVELAGAIADISRTVLVKDFRNINPANARVLLVEAGPRILAGFSESLSAKAQKSLEKLGVEVRVNARVNHISKQSVQVGYETIPSRVVLWAAGVEAQRVRWAEEVDVDRAGRIVVNSKLNIEGYPEVFVVGDMASIKNKEGFVPGLAPAAIQAGQYAAESILKQIKNQPVKDFKYVNKGIMATIGKKSAIVQVGKLQMTGFLAWVVWLVIHIFYLIGFKNRVSVMAQWIWSYVFSKRGSRLITDRNWRLKSNKKE